MGALGYGLFSADESAYRMQESMQTLRKVQRQFHIDGS